MNNKIESHNGPISGTATGTQITITLRSLGRMAMTLAMTSSRAEEAEIRAILAPLPQHRFAVTEVGGMVEEYSERLVNAVIGAALNSGVIEKSPGQMHALLHATNEAERGFVTNSNSASSFSTKVAIATDEKWIAVAIYGASAFHPITNHERAGLGVMHLRD